MTADRSKLRKMLTLSEPLGPIAHERIGDDVADDLVYHNIALFSELTSKPHMLFLGRKGAGKSAVLREIRLGTRKTGSPPGHHRGTIAPPTAYVIDVFSWRHFHQIVRNVNRQFRSDDVIDEMIPPEYFTELWHQMLWNEIIQHS